MTAFCTAGEGRGGGGVNSLHSASCGMWWWLGVVRNTVVVSRAGGGAIVVVVVQGPLRNADGKNDRQSIFYVTAGRIFFFSVAVDGRTTVFRARPLLLKEKCRRKIMRDNSMMRGLGIGRVKLLRVRILYALTRQAKATTRNAQVGKKKNRIESKSNESTTTVGAYYGVLGCCFVTFFFVSIVGTPRSG